MAYGESHVLRSMIGQLMTTLLADNPQAVQPTTGSCWYLSRLARLPHGPAAELKEGQILSDSDLAQCWLQNAHSVQVLAMQQGLLKPKWTLEGNLQGTISKAGGFLASSIECFVTVQ